MQETMAQRLRYPQERGLLRSESLMKDVYAHSRNIFRVTERITAQFASGYSSAKTRSLFGFLPRAQPAAVRVNGFVIQDRQLDIERPDLFTKNPVEMMRAIEIAQERQLEPSPELADTLSRKIGLITHPLRYAKEPREIFRRILSRKGEVGRALRLMHRLDFLGQYMPEFGELTCLVQHEFFHRYTADEHTLVCIEKLDALIDSESKKLQAYRKLFQKFDDPFVLYLALLLHDTGKASGARVHAEASALYAQKVAARLQLNSEQRKSLILLVDNHMMLSTTAQRRNLDDPATIEEFAGVVKTQANLDALMLLTLADGQGTGDENWSDWKEMLVWQLYHNTSQFLRDGEAFYAQRRIEREGLRAEDAAKLPRDFDEEIEAHFQFMPDFYFQINSADEIAAHIRHFREFLIMREFDPDLALAPAVKWIPRPEQSHSEVWICTWDRKALLAKIAGSFAVGHLNILSADIYTRGDSLVLDIFRVCDTKFQHQTVASRVDVRDRKSTRLNSSHVSISYAVFCLKKKRTD